MAAPAFNAQLQIALDAKVVHHLAHYVTQVSTWKLPTIPAAPASHLASAARTQIHALLAIRDITWRLSTIKTQVNVWPAVQLHTAKLAEEAPLSAQAAPLDTLRSLPSVSQIKKSVLL